MLLLFRSGKDNNEITPVSQILTQSRPTGSFMFINFAPLRRNEQLLNAGFGQKRSMRVPSLVVDAFVLPPMGERFKDKQEKKTNGIE